MFFSIQLGRCQRIHHQFQLVRMLNRMKLKMLFDPEVSNESKQRFILIKLCSVYRNSFDQIFEIVDGNHVIISPV